MKLSARLIPALVLATALAGCAGSGDIVVDEGVGITAVRSACPAVGIPDYTGDITLFRTPGDTTAGNIDLVKTGNTTATFTSNNTFAGTATLRGGAITLIDSGAFSGATSFAASLGTTLNLDNRGLVDTSRIPVGAGISLRRSNGGRITISWHGASSEGTTKGA